MEEKYLLVKATSTIANEQEAMETVIEMEGLEDSETAAHLMFGILNRIAYEWMFNGMDSTHCFNLFLHAARNAEYQVEEKKKANGEQ